MSELPSEIVAPLQPREVRVCTIGTGDSATVRATTRTIISSLIGTAPNDVELFNTPKGKPMLRNDPGLHCSISHSHDVSMIAVTRVAAVGVDIEQLRVVPNAEAILRRFFTHEAIEEILSDDRRDLRFIEAWTRAEARVKARGASVWEAAMPDADTLVRQLSAPDGFAAAVAVRAESWEVVQHDIANADVVMP